MNNSTKGTGDVAAFNFADSYRAAGLNPGPEILRLRQEPFDTLRKSIDPSLAVNLTRLYFGLEVPGGTDWFRDAFGSTDSSFSMYDNQREAAVLAAGLLESGLNEGKAYAGLAPLTAAAAGARAPLVRPELLEMAKAALITSAVDGRQRTAANPSLMKLPGKSKAPAEITALLQSPDWNKLGAILNLMIAESNEWTKNLTNQAFGAVKPLAEQVADLREEVDMLWWHIGGWSRALDKPFADLKPALVAVMAGLDLADLSRTSIGIAAAPAILQRTVSLADRKKAASVTLSDAVDAMSADELENLELEEALDSAPEICPVLTAFAKASEIGAGPAWHASYRKATQLEPTLAFSPINLATQVYRERLLLSALS